MSHRESLYSRGKDTAPASFFKKARESEEKRKKSKSFKGTQQQKTVIASEAFIEKYEKEVKPIQDTSSVAVRGAKAGYDVSQIPIAFKVAKVGEAAGLNIRDKPQPQVKPSPKLELPSQVLRRTARRMEQQSEVSYSQFRATGRTGLYLRSQAETIGAFGVATLTGGVSVVEGATALVFRPLQTVKGIGQFIIKPRETIGAVVTGVRSSYETSPVTLTGEFVGAAWTYKGITTGLKKLTTTDTSLKINVSKKPLITFQKTTKPRAPGLYQEAIKTFAYKTPKRTILKARVSKYFQVSPQDELIGYYSKTVKPAFGGRIIKGIKIPREGYIIPEQIIRPSSIVKTSPAFGRIIDIEEGGYYLARQSQLTYEPAIATTETQVIEFTGKQLLAPPKAYDWTKAEIEITDLSTMQKLTYSKGQFTIEKPTEIRAGNQILLQKTKLKTDTLQLKQVTKQKVKLDTKQIFKQEQILKTKTKLKLETAQKQMLGLSTKQITKSKLKVVPLFSLKQLQKQKTLLKVSTITALKFDIKSKQAFAFKPVSDVMFKQAQQPILKPILAPKYLPKQLQATQPAFISPQIQAFAQPPLDLKQLRLDTKKKKRDIDIFKIDRKQIKFSPKYTPSIEANIFKIRGKPDYFNIVSGLGVRPL